MQYKAREPDRDTALLIRELEPVCAGMGFALVELSLYRSANNNARIRVVVAGLPKEKAVKTGDETAVGIAVGTAVGTAVSTAVGTAELSRLHRALLPRLELSLEGRDLYVEVSSPGTDRLIKNGDEFRHYTGKAVRCWRSGASEWERGILRGSDTEKILLETAEGTVEMKYEIIAKAKLDG